MKGIGEVMRKCKYSKECWLLDEDLLLHGYKDKYGVHPDKELQCGFSYQVVTKKDKDKLYFFSLKKAREVLGNIPVHAGKCNIRCSVDNGMAVTKIIVGIGDYQLFEENERNIDRPSKIYPIITEILDKGSISIDRAKVSVSIIM